jgi:Uroporphyrinogen decarboxylase (URO-D)
MHLLIHKYYIYYFRKLQIQFKYLKGKIMSEVKYDGIHSLLPRKQMVPEARLLRDTYAITPGAPIVHREFGYYCLENWYEQGLDRDADLSELFSFNKSGNHGLQGLGWCEAEFCPKFEVKLIEDRGDTELEQDSAGRHVLFFKGRRNGFMPEYETHPVKDMKTWKEDVKWRMNPETPERFEAIKNSMPEAIKAAGSGKMITQRLIGGYMYLRSLIGPLELLYMVCDAPELIHDCMQTWFELADAVCAEHQKHVTFDEIFFAEDICFFSGPLIGPDMMNEFLIPYYQQLITNVKARQIDKSRHLYVQIDTDGFCDPTIPVYMKGVGMDAMSPFEVASNCDVVHTGKEYPNLIMSGGIDKRILAKSKDAIDRELERIMPTMIARGGYTPTCDHGVPEEVSLENYMHYRKRMLEYSPIVK